MSLPLINENPDGYAPHVDYSLVGNGRIAYNDQKYISLVNYFAKYENVEPAMITDYYLGTFGLANDSGDFKLAKELILKHYSIVPDDTAPIEVSLVDDNDDESDDEDSDGEFKIPAGAEILDLDDFDEPIDVDGFTIVPRKSQVPPAPVPKPAPVASSPLPPPVILEETETYITTIFGRRKRRVELPFDELPLKKYNKPNDYY